MVLSKPEVAAEDGPEVELKIGGKETGWPILKLAALLILEGGLPDLLLALRKVALKSMKIRVQTCCINFGKVPEQSK